jgi:TolB-like protein
LFRFPRAKPKRIFSGKSGSTACQYGVGRKHPQSREKLRITAQLINVADGYHLWSEDYDGDVRDIFTFQSNVAQRVVEALQIS